MTPKEKAKQLYDLFYPEVYSDLHEADEADYMSRRCALICIDEIINQLLSDWGDNQWRANEYIEFWQQVKEEINKL